MVDVLGFDIGGANTKAAYLHEENGHVNVKVASQYFPIWRNPDRLGEVLISLKSQLGAGRLDGLGVTMTAELSDAYQTKREGVNSILSYVENTFPDIPCYVINSSAQLISPQKAKTQPLEVASANWAATGWLLSKQLNDAVIVDVGSTSTSIIPIINGQVAAKGKTDLDKLICGELVYTGSLRTNIAAIVQSIPIRGGVSSVSSELFSTSGDIHLILGHITADEFTSETADGRGKTMHEAMARLSRVLCADTDMLTKQEIEDLANYIYSQQVQQIADGLTKVLTNIKLPVHNKVPIVVTGLGKDFLARKAAGTIGIKDIINLDSFLPKQAVLATPAVGVTLMTAYQMKGAPINWP